MKKSLLEKEKIVQGLNEKIRKAEAVFLLDFHGMNVEEMNKLREELRKQAHSLHVIKNTLALRASRGTAIEGTESYFRGNTALTFTSKDPIILAKILTDFMNRNEKLKIKVGIVKDRILSVNEIKRLSELPPKDVLIRILIHRLKSPISYFIFILSGIIGKFVNVLRSIEEKKREINNKGG